MIPEVGSSNTAVDHSLLTSQNQALSVKGPLVRIKRKMPDWALDIIDNFKYSFNVISYFGIINHLN